MADVKKFPAKARKKAPRVWVCNCGCSTFELLETGEARCAMCNTVSDHEEGGGWYLYPTDQEWAKDSPMRDISGNGEPEFIKQLMKVRIDSDDAALVILLEKSGRLHCWSTAETREEIDWTIEELNRAPALIDRLKDRT